MGLKICKKDGFRLKRLLVRESQRGNRTCTGVGWRCFDCGYLEWDKDAKEKVLPVKNGKKNSVLRYGFL